MLIDIEKFRSSEVEEKYILLRQTKVYPTADNSLQYCKQVPRREHVMRKHNDSERKSAGSPATAIQSHACKGVENNCVFSLSFGPFLSLFIRNKRERKGH